MHLEHNEKKYHIKFLKEFDESYRSTTNRRLLRTERLIPTNIESLLSSDASTVHGRSSDMHSSTMHRESRKRI